MTLPPFIRRIFRVTDFRPDPERTLAEEIEFHIDELTRELQEAGHPLAEARRLAEEKFGDSTAIADTCTRIERTDLRQQGRALMIDSLRRDTRFALRSLGRQPLFSGLIILMLALGIAGNTAVFSVVNTIFLRPFPWDESERLVDLDITAPQWNLEFVGIDYPDFLHWRNESQAFEAMGVFNDLSLSLAGEEGAERVTGITGTYDLIETLRLVPLIGRTFTPEDGTDGGPRVVMLIDSWWRDRWGGDPDIIGRSLTLSGVTYEIIGVLPDEAMIRERGQIWLPFHADPDDRSSYFLAGIGRLAPGVTREQAQEDLRRIQQNVIEAGVASAEALPIVTDLRERSMGDVRTAVYAVWGAIAVLLLIACANVASLMLTRTIMRRSEFGIRSALGAGRGTLTRQIFTESLVLALIGGAVGFGLGSASISLLAGAVPLDLPPWMRFEVDLGVQLFTLAVCVVTALAVGLVPIWRIRRRSQVDILREGALRTGTGRGTRRLLQAFVTTEVALTLGLLVTAALLGQTFYNLRRVDPGFEPEGVLTFQLNLPQTQYPEQGNVITFINDLNANLEALPGVEAAAAATSLPLRGHNGWFWQAEGAEPLPEGQADPVTLLRLVTPHYAAAAGIQMLAGRWLQDSDRMQVVVNETFARYHWGDEDPIGKRCHPKGSPQVLMEVVGLARDVRHYGLEEEMIPGIYSQMLLMPEQNPQFIIRTGGDPAALAPAVRATVADLDPSLPVFDVATMEEIIADSLSFRQATSLLLAIFAIVSLMLALGGVYGVISYAVSMRRREIGIRIALGAGRESVIRMIIGEGLRMILIGLGAGVILTLLLGRILSSLVIGVSATDAATLIVVSVVFLTIALAANLIPALRASATDPIETLRIE